MSRRLLDDSVKQQPGLPQAGPLESLRESWPNSVPRYPSVMDASDLSKSRGKGLHLWIQVHLDCILQVRSCLPVRWHALNETLRRQSKEAQLDSSCLYRGGDTTSSTMVKSLVEADERLLQLCANAKGIIRPSKEYTWKMGEKRAKLDHGICWNLTLTAPRSNFNETTHQRYDHGIISFGLLAEEFGRMPQPARRPHKIDAVFFQSHVQKWQEAIREKMLPASDEVMGEMLMAM